MKRSGKNLQYIFLMAILFLQGLGHLKIVKASSCNITINNVDPPPGEDVYKRTIYSNFTISWTAPENASTIDIGYTKYIWSEEKGDWLWISSDYLLEWRKNDGERPETQQTFQFPISTLDDWSPVKMVFWIDSDYWEQEWWQKCEDNCSIELSYNYVDKPIVNASFTMSPQSPVVGETVTFTSTTTTRPDKEIIELYWDESTQFYTSLVERTAEAVNKTSWSWVADVPGEYEVSLSAMACSKEGWREACGKDEYSMEFEVRALEVGVESDIEGVVADGFSSSEITVTLPMSKRKTVSLSDGVKTLTEEAVDGEAVFNYVPDIEELGLSISDIPTEGYSITLTAETEGGLSGTIPLKIYRRPVLLVHGLWSTAEKCWGHGKMEGWLEESGFDVYTLTYPSVQKHLQDVATDEFSDGIKEVKEDYLEKGVNCSKIDVVAHSMGGVISRAYINQYTEIPPNEEKVDIKTLITAGTPHEGSRMPQVYFDALKVELDWTLVVRLRTALQGLLDLWAFTGPEGASLTYGPALHDLVPDSDFLTRLNRCPNNQYVDYHVICGTDNFYAQALRVEEQMNLKDYNIDLDQWEHGDGIVSLKSARAPDRFPYSGYYVDERHTGLGSNPDVFNIIKKLLLGEKDHIPQQYKTPQKTEIKAIGYYIPEDADGPLFDIYIQKYESGRWENHPLYDASIEMGDRVKIVFNRWDPSDKEKMSQYLEMREHLREADVIIHMKKQEDQVYGKITFRLKLHPLIGNVWSDEPPEAWFQILSKSTVFIRSDYRHPFHSFGAHIDVDGDIQIIHDWGYTARTDPDVSINISSGNQTQIHLHNGSLLVNDWHNNSYKLTEGEMITQEGGEPLVEPTEFDESSLEKWWTEVGTGPRIQMADHILAKKIPEQEQPEPASEVNPGDTIYSYLDLEQVQPGDTVDWEFTSPAGNTYTDNLTLEYNGTGYAYTSLQIPQETRGEWTINIYLNEQQAAQETFNISTAASTKDETSNLLIGFLVLGGISIAGLYIMIKIYKKI